MDQSLVDQIKQSVGFADTARSDNKNGADKMTQAQHTAADCANSPEPDGSTSPDCQPGGYRHGQGRDQVQDAIDYFNTASSKLQTAEQPLQKMHDATKAVQSDVDSHPNSYTDPDRAQRELAELDAHVMQLTHAIQANHHVVHSNGAIGGLIQTLADGVMLNIAFSKAWKWIKEQRASAERVGSRAAEEGQRLRTHEGCEQVKEDVSNTQDEDQFARVKHEASEENKAQISCQTRSGSSRRLQGCSSESYEDMRFNNQEAVDEESEFGEKGDYVDEVDEEAEGIASDDALGAGAFGEAAEGAGGAAELLPLLGFLGLAELPPGTSADSPLIDSFNYPYAISLVEQHMGIGAEQATPLEHSVSWSHGIIALAVGSVIFGFFIGRTFYREQRFPAQPSKDVNDEGDDRTSAREPLLD